MNPCQLRYKRMRKLRVKLAKRVLSELYRNTILNVPEKFRFWGLFLFACIVMKNILRREGLRL